MRETVVSRFVRATPAELEHVVEPARVVEFEGSFQVLDVEERDGATRVTAGGGGVVMALRFEPRADGLYYEQADEEGPFDAMWTLIEWVREDEGSRVTATSGVSLGLPLAGVTDRVAAWKRRGELRRALAALAETVE